MLDCLKQHPLGTVISIHVQPRSSRNQMVGLREGSLKLKLTSPPVEGAANKCCREYLSKFFHLAKTKVELISGDKSRQKRILLHGLELQEVEVLLNRELGRS